MGLTIIPVKFSNSQLLEDVLIRLRLHFESINIHNAEIDLDEAYDIRRQQYYSTRILEKIKAVYEFRDDYVLVLTEIDLFVPVLTHIFGEAELRGRYSIVSTCRLHEEFYTSERNHALLLERTYKEIIHELGHNFGLLHCRDWQCVMHSSSGIEEVDLKNSLYCENCKTIIESKEIKYKI